MSNNRFIAALLACSVLVLAPLGANAATIGTLVGNVQLTANTSQSFTTSGAVPSGDLTVIGIASIDVPSAVSVTGCASWTAGATTNSGTARYSIFYCVPTGILLGATVSFTLPTPTSAVVCMAYYPATVTTHDLSSGTTGSGTTITATTGTGTQSSAILLTGVTWNNIGDISQDASSAALCADEGTGVVGGNLAERVLTSTAPVTSTMGLTSTSIWVASWDSFAYATGGAISHSRATLGVGF